MMIGFRIVLAISAIFTAGQAIAAVPFLNATCPGNIDVHADAGGPVYLNGKETKLKVVNENFYEATQGGVTLSISINPDGTPSISYEKKGGGNGICTVRSGSAAAPVNKPSAMPMGTGAVITPGNRPAYCRGEVSGMYGTKPSYIKTAKPKKTGSGTTIDGTVDKGNEGIKKFQCRFDGKGRFIDVMAMTPDGE
ncbi:hypothetical protein [Agrobacterium tumefaciens]|jgi:hypothetical protein|uniref:hypothetical protein n=1 Tax=Agrobacterium tumefaciens TaxID=358 RepID=UPI00023A5C06|nr:hypothetical protein AT5A_21111 [Agrobacterium tumefaciens 5A]